jgi:beta-glucosidase
LQLGITLNLTIPNPINPTDANDLDAARRIDGQFNRFFLDPIFRGSYPQDLLDDVAQYGLDNHIYDGDLEIISSPIDALGVNYYHGEAVSATPPATAPLLSAAPSERPKRSPFPAAEGVYWHPRGLPVTAMEWEVQPEGLTRLLKRVHDEYTGDAVKLYVTENGAAYDDVVEEDGSVNDVDRAEFLRLHLDAILDAIEQGVDVYGYFYWSLMDNYEWAWGYHKRFGIVRVDYDTLERTPKFSAHEYKRIIAARAL